MSQFKLRLQNIFKEIYPNDKHDSSSLQTNLNDLSVLNNKNTPIHNSNINVNNDVSFLNNTTFLNKSPSMKKNKRNVKSLWR